MSIVHRRATPFAMFFNLTTRTYRLLALAVLSALFVYKMESVGLELSRQVPEDLRRPQPVFIPTEEQLKQRETPSEADLDLSAAKADRKVWVTMALCWSANTKYHGKDGFPYKEALPYSTRLWMRLTKARVVVQIVYSEPEPEQGRTDGRTVKVPQDKCKWRTDCS